MSSYSKENGWAIGTKLFFVPIRFWEVQEPETGSVAKHGVCGKIVPDGNDPNYVYVFHHGWGHNVYMQRPRAFDTYKAAVAEAHRLKVEKEAEEHEEFEAIMARWQTEDWWPGNKAKANA